jgi:hypothetical protein
MPEPIPVRVRDCACPDTPHPDGDVVYLRPTLSLAGGIAAQQDLVASDGNTEELIRRWFSTYVRYGAVGWNFLDEAGPVPFTVETLLDDFTLGSPVAEMADTLYSEAVLAPLGLSRSRTSPTGPTAASTSRTRRSRSTSRASS